MLRRNHSRRTLRAAGGKRPGCRHGGSLAEAAAGGEGWRREWATFAKRSLRSALRRPHSWPTFASFDGTRPANRSRERSERLAKVGGESGIRTHGRVSPTHAFQACSFNHSDISPFDSLSPTARSRPAVQVESAVYRRVAGPAKANCDLSSSRSNYAVRLRVCSAQALTAERNRIIQ